MKTKAITTNLFGSILVISMLFLVNGKAKAQCNASFTSTNIDCNTIEFVGQSTAAAGDSVISCDWYFGDGVTALSLAPNSIVTHYYQPGVYNASLVITTDLGCIDTAFAVVEAYESPVASFVSADVCFGYYMCFTDMSVSNAASIISWSWDFGDGFTSTSQNPCHFYAAPGTYTVTLTVVNSNGCYSSDSQSVEIYPNPVADFTYEVNCSFEVVFTDMSISNAPSVTSWSWDFGDGGTSTAQNPTHTYPAPGDYSVCLIVVNSNGCIDTSCNVITVNSVTNTQLVAAFTIQDTTCAGTDIQFTDQSTTCTAIITSWQWDFDDGFYSTLQNPVHAFLMSGIYNVSLTVTADSMGVTLIDQVINPLMIFDNPVASFTFSSDVCPGSPVQFTSSTSTAVISYFWEFGDGGTSNLQHPVHTYQQAGDYIVSLIVMNDYGCTDTVLQSISIVEPVADFSYIPVDPEPGDTVFFTNLSSSPNGFISQWTWYFGDGDSTTINFPDNPDSWHVYSDSGNFLVELFIVDNNSCNNYTTQNVMVFSGNPIYPVADFSYDYSCVNQTVFFNDLSSPNGGSPLVSWFWDFGDGGTSNLQNPTYIYGIPGFYDISLVVTNADNLSDTVVYSLTADPLPDVSAFADPTTAQTGTPIQFYGSSGSQGIVSWMWTFGDGGSALTPNPVHVYQSAGTYNASLTVTDTAGCMNTSNVQVYIYEQPVFPEDSALWNIVGDNSISGDTWRFRYGLIGDTSISITDLDTSYAYTKVYSLYDSTLSSPYSSYFAAIRNTEDKKVFALIPGFEETLLYDYSLEIGDTAWFTVGGSLCYNDVYFWPENHYKVVTSIDSVLLENGEYRKRWNLQGNILNDAWVEGIGSTVWYGLFNPLIADIALCGDSYGVACIKEDETVLYLNNPLCLECFCSLLTDIDDQEASELEQINIYPNPADKTMYLQSANKIDRIRISDMNGTECYRSEPGSEYIQIPVGSLVNGVYVMEILSSEKVIVKKFIIQHP